MVWHWWTRGGSGTFRHYLRNGIDQCVCLNVTIFGNPTIAWITWIWRIHHVNYFPGKQWISIAMLGYLRVLMKSFFHVQVRLAKRPQRNPCLHEPARNSNIDQTFFSGKCCSKPTPNKFIGTYWNTDLSKPKELCTSAMHTSAVRCIVCMKSWDGENLWYPVMPYWLRSWQFA